MKASELRSGNFIKLFKNGKPHLEWYELDSHDIYKLDESNCEDVEPIPLTEEWLLKFGFKFNGDIKFWIEKLCLHTKDNELYILYDQGRVFIQYVHQLQNLYFSLTNTELTWNGEL